MARKIVAGNWKMNLNAAEAVALVKNIKLETDSDVRVIVFPSSIFASEVQKASSEAVEVGVQNFHAQPKGAYTGEISIDQTKSIGCHIGLIGHSERREYFQESHSILKEKVDAAIENRFEFIFCCGEPLEVREAGNEMNYVRKQLEESLFHLSAEQLEGGIIAYEPVWAIGTGRTASSEQAEEMHASIRTWLTEVYNEEIAQSISILYGGSCKPANATELFACPNVDGGLIGGAALEAGSFLDIIKSY